MYIELEKFKTGRKIKNGFVSVDTNQTLNVNSDEYIAPLGDLLNDFIKHENKWWWQKKYYHNHVSQIYIDILNKISVVHIF